MNRFRTKGSFTTKSILATQHVNAKENWDCSKPKTTWLYWQGYLNDVEGETSQMWDFVQPNFRVRRRSGEIMMNRCDLYRSTLEPYKETGVAHFQDLAMLCSGGNQYAPSWEYRNCSRQWNQIATQNFVGGGGSYQQVHLYALHNATEVDWMIKEACTSCLNQRGRSDSNLWETVAELDKSTTLLSGIFNEASKVIARKRDLLYKVRGIAGAWLSLRYGLGPLLSDAEGIVEGLDKRLGMVRDTSRGSVRNEKTDSFNSSGTAWCSTTFTIKNVSKETVTIRAMSLDEYRATLMSNIGFTTKGLLTLPWELIPSSFVFDWFVNMGDYLGALAVTPGVNQLGQCYTVRRERSLTKTFINTTSTVESVLSPWNGEKIARTVQYSRYPGLVAPALGIKSDFRFDNFRRCADAAALAAQRVGDILRRP